VAEFLTAARAYLRRERARNTVLLTVTEQSRVNPARNAAAEAGGTDPPPRLALPAGNLAFPGRGGILSSLC